MYRVGIIHPWMPQYRTRFFDILRQSLAERAVDLDVFYGDTPREWADRNDAAHPEMMTRLETKFYRIGNRNLSYKDLGAVLKKSPYDLLILEQAIRNIETYALMLRPGAYRRLAYWGHGRTYTVQKSSLEEELKSRLTRRGDWFFGYTAGGVDSIVEKGFSKDRVTVVQNSIDTVSMRNDLDSISQETVQSFRRDHGLTEKTAVYIGGLDEAKRIPFLLESAGHAHDLDHDFRLIIVGDGSMADVVRREAEARPWLSYLGSAFGREKALALKAAKLLAIPGRVGLIAVDSLTSGVPIVTTDWPFHAPEFEYLGNGYTAQVARNDPADFAESMVLLLQDSRKQRLMANACVRESSQYTAESMGERFATGIMQALAGGTK